MFNKKSTFGRLVATVMFFWGLTVLLPSTAHASGHASGQEVKKDNRENIKLKIDNYLNAIAKKNFSGSVLVSYKGDLLLSKGFGKSDVKNNINNTPKTVFDMLSVSKQITAAAILKLEMQGGLSVNDKISKYFDNVPADKANIAINQLLTHPSGFEDIIGDDYEYVTKEQFVKEALNTPLLSLPDSTYYYSNTGYNLLAAIIEQASKTNYEAYQYENLFKPAKMEFTGFTRPDYTKNMVSESTGVKSWGVEGPSWYLIGESEHII